MRHALRIFNTATIGGVSVWTDRYRKPRRTIANYFKMIDTRTSENVFVKVLDLMFCSDCSELFFMGRQMQASFLEPNRIQLTDSGSE